jgi:transcriptional antiterminator RfaH
MLSSDHLTRLPRLDLAKPAMLIAPDRLQDDACTGWFLVHTKPRQEDMARQQLERQGFSCYLPRLNVEKVLRQRTQVVSEPMFPRYLFVQLDTSLNGPSWAPIRSTVGVSRLVRFGTQPAQVDGALIGALRSRESEWGTQTLFNPGDAVTVTSGPFAGLDAVFQTRHPEQRSLILLEILSKPVPLSIDTAALRKRG